MVSAVFPVVAGVALVAFGAGTWWAGFDVYPLGYVAAGVVTLAVSAAGTPLDATLFAVFAVTVLALGLAFSYRRRSVLAALRPRADERRE